MIPSALCAALALAAEPDDDPLAPHRVPFPELAERAIGTASQPVEFNWRRTKVHGAATGSQLFELNNFNSLRVGGLARFPTGGALVELGVSYVRTWDTPSSALLALTPYRQPGRPDRMDVDLAVGFPIAEGVVTVAPRFFPSLQLVLNAYVGLRYQLYPDAFEGMKAGEVFGAVLSPALTEAELDNLEDRRLDAMQVDTGRYGLTVGLGNDLYFRQGFFLSPRASFSLPVLAPASGTELLFWGDVSLAVGFAR
ncbi:MAG: hypothetical protein ACOZNI_21920 [Myxococcota bacterium]